MAIEFSSCLNGINNSIYNIPFLNNVFSSIIYTSIVLSILIIILIIFIYPCKKDTPSWILVKLFIYLFTVNAIIFSAQHSMTLNNYKEKSSDVKSDEFITNINKRGGNIYNKENIKVVPNFNEREQIEEDHIEEEINNNKELNVGDMLDAVERSFK